MTPAEPRRSPWVWAVGLIVLHVVLTLPNRIEWVGLPMVLQLPLELPAILLALWLLPLRARRAFGVAVGTAAALVLTLKLADMAAHAALARPFNPILDLHLATASWHLLRGTLGAIPTVLIGLAGLLAVIVTGALAARGIQGLGAVLPRSPLGRGRPPARQAGLVFGLGLALTGFGITAAQTHGLTTETSQLVRDHGRFVAGSLRDLRAFQAAARLDPFRDVADERLLEGLAGKDVLLLFVESYGRSALEHPLYAPTIQPTLVRFEATLAASGYTARSGWVTAPMVGGQSWLAHASVLSGLWIDNQRRYQSLLASDRATLVHDFGRAGWETVAVMPAITMAWPESTYFGYDRVHAAADLGYRGEPFNWVTMPDQYTMSALNRLELDRQPRPPILAEVALISSHAPWVPIPPVIDWGDVGDGSVFTPYARSGDPPAVVWRDPDRIRAQYLKAVDYALQNLESYIAHFGRDDLVVVILGDHQPAPIVTGPDASFDVPIHVLSRDPAVIAAIDAWSWTPGMRPAAALPSWRMDAFRDRWLAAFTPAPTRPSSAEAPLPPGHPAEG